MADFKYSILLVVSMCAIILTASDSVERRLLSTLFESYNSNARPVKSSSTCVQVKMVYYLLSLENINMKEEVMTAFGLIDMIWKDELLTWDENDYSVSSIIVEAEKVWLPDVVIYNSAEQIYGEDLLDPSKYKVEVSSDGTVAYSVGGLTNTFCQLNLRTFPFDVQTCYIKVASWTYSSAQVNFSAFYPDTSYYHTNGQWDLYSTTTVTRNDVIDGVPFAGVKFILELKRKPLFYTVTFLIPCVLLSLIVLFVFLLPADAGEKVGLSITVVLSFGVFQFMLIDYMPPTSDYTPLITVYVTYVLVLSTLSLLFTVLLLILTFNDGPTEPPKWLRALAFGCVAKITCKERCCPKKRNDADVNSIIFRSSREKMALSGDTESCLEIDKISATTNGSGMRVSSDFPKVWICEKKERASTETAARSRVSTISLRPLTTDLASLLHKNQEYNTSAKEEWLEIAQLFDRILLILFFIATMVIIVVVFAISPNVDNDFHTFSSEDQVLNTKV